MDRNYSIDEIIAAVNDLQNIKKERKFKAKENKPIKKENFGIPKNTLRLIEEAEKIKKLN